MLEIRHLTKRFNGIPVVEDVIQHPARRDPGLCRSQRRRIDPGLRPCPADGFGGWGFSAADPFALVGIPLVLGLSAALASHIPARRATRIDPLAALRDE